MAATPSLVGLRPASSADWPLIRRWLRSPDVVRFWGPASATEAEVMMAMSSEHAICRIVEAEGAAIGYGQAIDATVWGSELPDDLPPGTYDLDLFIAEAAYRGRGLGGEAVRLLKEEVFATTLAVAVSVFASIANEQAVRAYERAGFRWRRVWHDPNGGPEWFMLAERPVAPA